MLCPSAGNPFTSVAYSNSNNGIKVVSYFKLFRNMCASTVRMHFDLNNFYDSDATHHVHS